MRGARAAQGVIGEFNLSARFYDGLFSCPHSHSEMLFSTRRKKSMFPAGSGLVMGSFYYDCEPA